MVELTIPLADEAATVRVGEQLGALLAEGGVLWLRGDLGAGKTTFSRGVLRGCGHTGGVKSPTYTLVEPYELPLLNVFHFDLYRVHDPEELEYMGFRDYLDPSALLLIEWPEHGESWVPAPDLELVLSICDSARQLQVVTHSERGKALLARWSAGLESRGGD